MYGTPQLHSQSLQVAVNNDARMMYIMSAIRNGSHALGCTCYDFRSDANKRNANMCKLCCMSVSRPSLARDSEQQHLRKKCPLAKAGSWLETIVHFAETLHEGRYDCAGRRAFGTHAPRHKTNNTFPDGLCQGAAKFGRNVSKQNLSELASQHHGQHEARNQNHDACFFVKAFKFSSNEFTLRPDATLPNPTLSPRRHGRLLRPHV